MVTAILLAATVVFATVLVGSLLSKDNGTDRQTDVILTLVVAALFTLCVIGVLVQNRILYIELDL